MKSKKLRKRRANKKRYITLLEVLLGVFLLSLCLGALGIKSYRAIQQQRFQSSVEAVIAKVALAQQIRLAFHTNVSIQLEIKSSCLQCELQVSDPLPTHLTALIARDRELKGIRHIEFEGVRDSKVTLSFPWSTGEESSRGNLWLSSSANRDDGTYLPLPGYPAPITKSASKIDFEPLNDAPYPEEIQETQPVEQEKKVVPLN